MNSALNSSPPLAPLAQRRRTVLIGVFGFALLLISQYLHFAGSNGALSNGLSVMALVIIVFGWSRLIFGLIGLPPMDPQHLDERQQIVVTRAYAVSYRLLSGGTLLVYAFQLLANTFASLPKLSGDVNAIALVGIVWIVIGLPSAILAWTEPDMPSDLE